MKTMSKTTRLVHMCVDIEGVYNWPDSDLRGLFKGPDGSVHSAKEIREWLRAQLAAGKLKLPIGKACKGWSDVTGCPGHDVKEEA